MFSAEEHFTLDLVTLLIYAPDVVPPVVLIYLGKTKKKNFQLGLLFFSIQDSELRK